MSILQAVALLLIRIGADSTERFPTFKPALSCFSLLRLARWRQQFDSFNLCCNVMPRARRAQHYVYQSYWRREMRSGEPGFLQKACLITDVKHSTGLICYFMRVEWTHPSVCELDWLVFSRWQCLWLGNEEVEAGNGLRWGQRFINDKPVSVAVSVL